MYDLLIADEKLDREALDKAEQLKGAPSESRDKLQAELAEIVGKHFAARQKRRELQLKRMEEEIQRLRDAIQARNEAREEIVKKRISELTGEVNPLDF
jgi:5-carboxymethyl-2-hydroxymuconate isomerase